MTDSERTDQLYRHAATIALLKDNAALQEFYDNLTPEEQGLLAERIKETVAGVTASWNRLEIALRDAIESIGAWAISVHDELKEAGYYDLRENSDPADSDNHNPEMGRDAGPG